MKKIKYYKAKRDGKKEWFAESEGEPVKIELPSGRILELACEFIRGDGWRVTDVSTGYLMQNRRLANKAELTAFLNEKRILEFIDRESQKDYYKKAQQKLTEYKKQFSE